MKYVEERKMFIDDLRKLCIEEKWFTKADNEEYEAFLMMTKKENLTTNDLAKMAKQVMKYSELEDEEITSVMFCLARICYVFFGEEA